MTGVSAQNLTLEVPPWPIGEFSARYPWNQESIVDHVPHASGVYAIFDSQKWIYVGEAADIQIELLRYLNRNSPAFTGSLPIGFRFELVAAAQRVARQEQLISVLRPARNHRSTPCRPFRPRLFFRRWGRLGARQSTGTFPEAREPRSRSTPYLGSEPRGSPLQEQRPKQPLATCRGGAIEDALVCVVGVYPGLRCHTCSLSGGY